MYIRARELTVIGSVCNNCVLHLKISLCKMETFLHFWFQYNISVLEPNFSIVNECSLILFFPKSFQVEAMLISWFTIILLFGSSVGIQPPVVHTEGCDTIKLFIVSGTSANSRCISQCPGTEIQIVTGETYQTREDEESWWSVKCVLTDVKKPICKGIYYRKMVTLAGVTLVLLETLVLKVKGSNRAKKGRTRIGIWPNQIEEGLASTQVPAVKEANPCFSFISLFSHLFEVDDCTQP